MPSLGLDVKWKGAGPAADARASRRGGHGAPEARLARAIDLVGQPVCRIERETVNGAMTVWSA
jgi:hypothetical protein